MESEVYVSPRPHTHTHLPLESLSFLSPFIGNRAQYHYDLLLRSVSYINSTASACVCVCLTQERDQTVRMLIA